jgi:hypothetical protein
MVIPPEAPLLLPGRHLPHARIHSAFEGAAQQFQVTGTYLVPQKSSGTRQAGPVQTRVLSSWTAIIKVPQCRFVAKADIFKLNPSKWQHATTDPIKQSLEL